MVGGAFSASMDPLRAQFVAMHGAWSITHQHIHNSISKGPIRGRQINQYTNKIPILVYTSHEKTPRCDPYLLVIWLYLCVFELGTWKGWKDEWRVLICLDSFTI